MAVTPAGSDGSVGAVGVDEPPHAHAPNPAAKIDAIRSGRWKMVFVGLAYPKDYAGLLEDHAER
jgi:hypothetical protein